MNSEQIEKNRELMAAFRAAMDALEEHDRQFDSDSLPPSGDDYWRKRGDLGRKVSIAHHKWQRHMEESAK